MSSAAQATEFSRIVSTLGPCGFDSKSVGILSNVIPKPSDAEQKMLKSHTDRSGNAVKYCNTSTVMPTSKKGNMCEEDGEGCQYSKNITDITLREVEACFCYSCRLIAREMVCIKFEISHFSHY